MADQLPQAAAEPRRAKLIIAIALGVLLAGGASVGIWSFCSWHSDAEMVDDVINGEPDERMLLEYLSSGNDMVVSNALTRLEFTGSPVVRDRAVELLASDDPYLWRPASTYLGMLHEPIAVPYLIRHLNTPHWRGHDRVARYLAAMTGQDSGTDAKAWIAWWQAANTESTFSLDPVDKAPESGRLSK